MKDDNVLLQWSSDREFGTYSSLNIFANIVDADYIDDDEDEIVNVKTVSKRIIKVVKARRFVYMEIPVFYNVSNSADILMIESFLHAPYKRITITPSAFPGQTVLASFTTGNTINLITKAKAKEYWSNRRNMKLFKITLYEEESTYNVI